MIVLAVVAVVAVVALAACAVEAWVFVFLYARVEWRRTQVGRHLMRLTALLAVTFTFTLLFQVVPVPPLFAVSTSAVLFVWMAVEIGTRVYLLVKAQRTNRPLVED